MKKALDAGFMGYIIKVWKRLVLVVKNTFVLSGFLKERSIVVKNVSISLEKGRAVLLIC